MIITKADKLENQLDHLYYEKARLYAQGNIDTKKMAALVLKIENLEIDFQALNTLYSK